MHCTALPDISPVCRKLEVGDSDHGEGTGIDELVNSDADTPELNPGIAALTQLTSLAIRQKGCPSRLLGPLSQLSCLEFLALTIDDEDVTPAPLLLASTSLTTLILQGNFQVS